MTLTDAHREVLYGLALQQMSNFKRVMIHNNHTLFKYEIITDTISEAKLEDNKVVLEVGHIYVPALNRKNALRKYTNIFNTVIAKVEEQELQNKSHALSLQGEENKSLDKTENT